MTASFLFIMLIFLGSSIGGGGRFFSEHEIKTVSYQITTDHENEQPHSSWPESEGIKYEALKQTLLSTPDGEKAKEWSKYHTAGPHLAGKNFSQAGWTRDKWVEFGVHHAEIVTYHAYINYPLDAGLSILKDGMTTFKASLEEEASSEDPTTSLPDRIPAFHGYSANGNVTGQFVYANYGTFKDYQELLDAGIELKGKVRSHISWPES
jgi:N-acetylated-alpha-linked acidic dipeptidase